MPDQMAAVGRTPGSTGSHQFASLLVEAEAESHLHINARNRSTGAAGPFQFLESTWLAQLHQAGEAMGVKPDLLRQITLDGQGRPHVASAKARSDLLALRYDPVLATKVAAHYLDQGKAYLQHLLKRQPTEAEVHLTFLLGPAGAGQLIRAAEATPDAPVDGVVGAAAAANGPLFLDHAGKPRSAAEAVAFLERKYQSDKSRVAAYAQLAPAAPGARKIDA